MAVRVPWDEEETVLLIDAYLQVEAERLPTKKAVSTLSYQLRQRAKQAGIEIDDVFRNENGIKMRLDEIQYLMTDGKSGLSNTSALFKRMVHLYQTDSKQFHNMLIKARKNIGEKKFSKEEFVDWLSNQITAHELLTIKSAFSDVDSYAVMKKLLPGQLFEVSESEQISRLSLALKKDWWLRLRQRAKHANMVAVCNHYERYLLHKQKEMEESLSFDSFAQLSQEANKKISTQNAFDKIKPVSINEVTASEKHQENRSSTKNTMEACQIENGDEHDLSFVDFNSDDSYAYTKPVYIEYFGEYHEVSNWTQMYIKVLAALYEDYPVKIQQLAGRSLHDKGRMWLGSESHRSQMARPVKFIDNLYAEANLSASAIIQRVRELLDYCLVDVEHLIVAYRHNQETSIMLTQQINNVRKIEGKQNKSDPLHMLFRNAGIEFVDNRHTGGNLWIIGGYELKPVVDQLQKMSLHFRFRAEGGRRTGGRPAWWTRDTLLSNSKVLTPLVVPESSSAPVPCPETKSIAKEHAAISKPAMQQTAKQSIDNRFSHILKEHFRFGFHLESTLAIRRLRNEWQQTYGEELADDDSAVQVKLRQSGVVHNERVYHLDSMLSQEKRERLVQFIHQWMVEERKIPIYYEALYQAFSEHLLGEGITGPDMLRSCLEAINPGYYRLEKKYLSLGDQELDDHVPDVIQFLKDQGRPMKIEEIHQEMPHLTQELIRNTLREERSIINSGTNEYFHLSILDLDQAQIDAIAQVIQSEINEYYYISGNELVALLRIRLPHIMDPYAHIPETGIRKALGMWLSDRFSFVGNLVSALGRNLSIPDMYAHFCRKHKQFTLQDLYALRDSLGQNPSIYFDVVYDNALRISEEEFVAKDRAQFDINGTDAAIDLFCPDDYIPLEGITSFSAFPDAGYLWNVYLLEHYVYAYSSRYRLEHNGFRASQAKGAIVKKDAPYMEFRDVLAHDLAGSKVALQRDDVLDYFVKKGYIARKSLAGIEGILLAAQQIRNRRG